MVVIFKNVFYKAWRSKRICLQTVLLVLHGFEMFSTKLGSPKGFVYKRSWCSMVLFAAAGRASAHTDYLRKRKLRIGGMHYGGNTTVCLLSVIPLNLIPFLNRHIFYTFEQLSAWGIHWTCFKNKEMRSLLINWFFTTEFWNQLICSGTMQDSVRYRWDGEIEERKQEEEEDGGQLRQGGIHEDACPFKHLACPAFTNAISVDLHPPMQFEETWRKCTMEKRQIGIHEAAYKSAQTFVHAATPSFHSHNHGTLI